MSSFSAATDILTASYGRSIALAYGRHVVGGNVVLMDQSDPAFTTMFVALGEGPWDGIDELIVNGAIIDLATSNVYHFHKGWPGEISSSDDLAPEGVGSPFPFDTDGDQKADGFTPAAAQGLTYSKTAYLALKLPFDEFAPSATVTMQGVFRCRQVYIYSNVGIETSFTFSFNPVWQIVDLLINVRGLSASRLDWATFKAAADYCDAQVPAPTVELPDRTINRFVSNIAFTQPVDFDQALNAILVTCRGSLLDSGGLISMRCDQVREPGFDFTMDNIVENSFSSQYQDTRAIANRLVMGLGDPENNYVRIAKNWNHEPQQLKVGRVVVAQLELGNMTPHQASRIGDYLLVRAINNNLYCRLRGTQASLAVMPGDVVRVAHDAAAWQPSEAEPDGFQEFEVLEVTDNPDETRDFLLQLYSDDTYTDIAGPSQQIIGGSINRNSLPTPRLWLLTANLFGDLRLAFDIPEGADYLHGFLSPLVDDEPNRISTSLAADLADTDTTMEVFSSEGFQVAAPDRDEGYVNVGSEIVKLTGPGVPGEQPSSNTWEIARAQKLSSSAPLISADLGHALTSFPLTAEYVPGSTADAVTDPMQAIDQDPETYGGIVRTHMGLSNAGYISIYDFPPIPPDAPVTVTVTLETSDDGTATSRWVKLASSANPRTADLPDGDAPTGYDEHTSYGANSVVDCSGVDVARVSGDSFETDGSWSGKKVLIDGALFTIDHVIDGDNLVLTTSAGTLSGVAFSSLGKTFTKSYAAGACPSPLFLHAEVTADFLGEHPNTIKIYEVSIAIGRSAGVYKLTNFPLDFAILPGYTLANPTVSLADGPYFVKRFRPGRLRIVYASFRLSNAQKLTELLEQTYLAGGEAPLLWNSLPGLRTCVGMLETIVANGPLFVSKNIAPRKQLPDGASLGPLSATMDQGPMGDDVVFRIDSIINGFIYQGGEITIPRVSTAGDPSGSGIFADGALFGNVIGVGYDLVILKTGTDDPGSNLKIHIPW